MKIAPKHLSTAAKRWWRSLQAEYGIGDAGGLALLTAAAECWQRAGEARALVDAEGVVIKDRFGQSQQHPAVRIERESREQLIRALKTLQLDVEPLKAPGRPTTPTGYRGSHAD